MEQLIIYTYKWKILCMDIKVMTTINFKCFLRTGLSQGLDGCIDFTVIKMCSHIVKV